MFVCLLHCLSRSSCGQLSGSLGCLSSLSLSTLPQLESQILLSKHLGTALSVPRPFLVVCKYAGVWDP